MELLRDEDKLPPMSPAVAVAAANATAVAASLISQPTSEPLAAVALALVLLLLLLLQLGVLLDKLSDDLEPYSKFLQFFSEFSYDVDDAVVEDDVVVLVMAQFVELEVGLMLVLLMIVVVVGGLFVADVVGIST